jgi:DNA-binding response OmpR family regulator
MRRRQAKRPVIRLGPLKIDAARKQVSRRGAPLRLTPSEYRLIEFLAHRRGRVFSPARLLEHLRGSASTVSSNVLEVLVSALRRKIHVLGEPPILRTRRGFGYFVDYDPVLPDAPGSSTASVRNRRRLRASPSERRVSDIGRPSLVDMEER